MATPALSLSRVKQLAVLCASSPLPSLSCLAKKLAVARATAWNYCQRIRASGLSFTDFAALHPTEMGAALGRRATHQARRPLVLETLFVEAHPRVHSGTSVKALWTEYRAAQPDGYGYTRFAAQFQAWRAAHHLPPHFGDKWRVVGIPLADLPTLRRWRRSNDRGLWARAAVVLDSSRGASLTSLCAKVERSRRIVNRWLRSYTQQGLEGLRPKEKWPVVRRRARERGPRLATLLNMFPQVYTRLAAEGASLKHLWAEYKTEHPTGYAYTQFGTHFGHWRAQNGVPPPDRRTWRVHDILAADLPTLRQWRRSNDGRRWAQAVVLLGSQKGMNTESLCAQVKRSPRLVNRWIRAYTDQGLAGLQKRKKRQSPTILAEMQQTRDRIIALLHETPGVHGINRTSWSLKSLAEAYRNQYGESIGMSTVSEYVTHEGYAFRKARRVLTSPDPRYREKLQEITTILENLQPDEKFFSIDEFGPFTVRLCGGRAYTPPGTTRVVPQWQRSKGRLIVTGALELSTNQMTHFYSPTKNSAEMLTLLDLLLRQYADQRCLYLSWDAASWHASAQLRQRVAEINCSMECQSGHVPMVKLAPLPVSAQFLNVIESVFSGMAKAILHNSDYSSVDECKAAIDRYFAERNAAYQRNPRRAGNKIWGKELVLPCFSASNNCKDPDWR